MTDENARLAQLTRLAILDTSPEQAYDDITRLAASLLGVPIALISFVDSERQWFKSRFGLESPQTPREDAFCAFALETPNEVTVVADAQRDARFADNPLVTGYPHIRFYAGAPIVTAEGHALGTVCVIDTKPRQLGEQQLLELKFLSRQVVAMLESRLVGGRLKALPTTPAFLVGGGVSGELMRRHDWASTPLGPPESWPEALQNAVRTVLASPMPMRVTWGDARHLIYNDAYVLILGDLHPGALARPLDEVWPEAVEKLQEVIARVHGGETVQQSDLSVRVSRFGRQEDVLLSYSWSPIMSDSRVAGVLCMCREQRDLVRERNEELERLRSLFEQSPSFVAVLEGPDHVFKITNPAYLRLIGNRDVIGMPVRIALPEVAEQGFCELLDQVYATGEPFVGRATAIELDNDRAERERRYVDFTYQPLKTAHGTVSGIFVEGVDVTTSKSAIDAIKLSEEKFRSFAQAMPNQVWAALPGGEIDWVNDQTLGYSGCTLADLVGSGWLRTVHPDDAVRVWRAWSEAIATGERYQAELRLRRHDGAYRWHLARAMPIRGADGTVTQWVGSSTDVEDERVAREKLEALNETLEQRVEERTRERAALEDQLRQSQKMEAVGQLTGGIAHDFNNMLAAILGSVQLSKKRVDEGKLASVPRLLELAEGSIRRATALTQRLLAFARRQPLNVEPVAVDALMRSLEDMFVRALGPSIRLQLLIADDLWTARTDAAQLESALLNLAINARDAMPGGGRLTVEALNGHLDERYAARHADLRAGDYLVIKVTDTGTGMPPDVLAKAFDPFFTTKPLGQGTGLGLSMVFGFIKQSGGHLRLHSLPGQGTTVTLYLPRESAEPIDTSDTVSAFGQLGASGETVLLVEDDPTLRSLQAEVLTDLGYRHFTAEDAPSALRILNSDRKVDLLLTDVGLPGMNGRQLADLACQIRPDMPIVFLTGYAGQPTDEPFLGPNMYVLGKPIEVGVFAATLRSVLDKHRP